MLEWLLKLFRRERKHIGEQQLAALIRGFQSAAAASMDLVGEQYIRLLHQFFDTKPDGTMQPKMVRLQVEDGKYILVPLVSLAPSKGIGLETMRVRFSVRLDTEASERVVEQAGSDLGSESLKVTVALDQGDGGERGRRVDVILEFKAGEAPESVRQVLNIYTDAISQVHHTVPQRDRQMD